MPPVSQRKRGKHTESSRSNEAALPYKDTFSSPWPNEHAVAGSSHILPGDAPPPDLSAYQPLLGLLLAFYGDIVDYIASRFAELETELSTLGQRIAPLLARIDQAEKEVTTLVNMFSDARSEWSERRD